MTKQWTDMTAWSTDDLITQARLDAMRSNLQKVYDGSMLTSLKTTALIGGLSSGSYAKVSTVFDHTFEAVNGEPVIISGGLTGYHNGAYNVSFEAWIDGAQYVEHTSFQWAGIESVTSGVEQSVCLPPLVLDSLTTGQHTFSLYYKVSGGLYVIRYGSILIREA
jgi:hypothetical protein